MTEKENNQRHESTIDKYFTQTAKAYETWAEENKEGRNFLQVAVEITGGTYKEGEIDCDLHISYSYKTDILARGIAQTMERDEDFRQLIIESTRLFLSDK